MKPPKTKANKELTCTLQQTTTPEDKTSDIGYQKILERKSKMNEK